MQLTEYDSHTLLLPQLLASCLLIPEDMDAALCSCSLHKFQSHFIVNLVHMRSDYLFPSKLPSSSLIPSRQTASQTPHAQRTSRILVHAFNFSCPFKPAQASSILHFSFPISSTFPPTELAIANHHSSLIVVIPRPTRTGTRLRPTP